MLNSVKCYKLDSQFDLDINNLYVFKRVFYPWFELLYFFLNFRFINWRCCKEDFKRDTWVRMFIETKKLLSVMVILRQHIHAVSLYNKKMSQTTHSTRYHFDLVVLFWFALFISLKNVTKVYKKMLRSDKCLPRPWCMRPSFFFKMN